MTKKEWDNLDADDKECESCGYPTVCKEYISQRNSPWMLCDICASTPIGNINYYPVPPSFGFEHREIMMTIGWIGNRIIDECRSMKERP
jgi:hypothetical protein